MPSLWEHQGRILERDEEHFQAPPRRAGATNRDGQDVDRTADRRVATVAVADHVRLARTVGRVAAKNPAFGNPHRVLKQGGLIPPDWRHDDGGGPRECERRLRAEGIEFEGDAAAAKFRIGWEEIKTRLVDLDDEGDVAGLPAAA